ncbi:MAG: CoB--CoM heterodisulfide reductase iron-sulfur subunit A family protein [Candidatus Lokiarchaeota archaeon]|nr:CoB--CoM heterodisulfide reductase iron-sulfur subunit A family protein [Candidatus Lokiarchaeota archaeon]
MSEKESEDVRIGVFICSCGSNIGGFVDVKEVAEYAKSLPNVVFTEDNLYTCSETGLAQIRKGIREHNLNRVVVASCTPRTHEPLFRDCIKDEGLNEYLFQFVNIRDQCTWVHMKHPKETFEKIKDVIRMGVAKAAKLEALENIVVDATPTAMVIGGGVAGITAALSLANQGFKTHLIERDDKLGGKLNVINKLFPTGQAASELLESLNRRVESNPNLTVYTSASVKSVEGFVGNYEIEVEQKGKNIDLNIGVIVVAVGASLLTPKGKFSYDGNIRITQYELEKKLQNNEVKAKDIVMIQCVGARNDERKYCSNVCCMTALKNALLIKEKNPQANITILFRDLYTPGTHYEEYYRRAREAGIIFLSYKLEKKPIVEENNIKAFNEYIGEVMTLPYDLLVLSTPLIANDDNKELAQMLKVPLEENKFFLEAHVKLRPMDFATDGVFICGAAKWPVDLTESITQGYAAAGRASTIISHDTIEVEGATSFLPEYTKNLCTGCEVCITVCPYKAISKNENDEIEITQVLCKGCGVCGATCTNHAIIIRHFTDQQILSEIYAYGGKEV